MTSTSKPTFAATPVLGELLHLYPSLPPAERRIADLVLQRPRAVLGSTTGELALRVGASQPAASRLCARLSTRTFAGFKVRLAQELGVAPESDDAASRAAAPPPKADAAETMLSAIVRRTDEDLGVALRAVAMLDPGELDRAAEAIRSARSIVVCGFDLSGSVAWRLAGLLHLAGYPARAERDPGDAPWLGALASGDLLFVVSYRGTLPQLLPTLRSARARGATLLALTNEAHGDLAGLADHLLLTRAPAARTDAEYVTGPALLVQLAAARALWHAVTLSAPAG